MNLSIEDLEAIKAIVRKTVREELERITRQQSSSKPAPAQSIQQQPVVLPAALEQEQSAEVVARIHGN